MITNLIIQKQVESMSNRVSSIHFNTTKGHNMAAVETLNDSNFTQKVLQGKGEIMVEFFATWCPHCQRMAPVINDLANQLPDITFYRVDIDESPDLANEYAPNGFPTFVVFENGQNLRTTAGEQPEAVLISFLTEN